ncbi:hypothetical protein ALQ63_02046 [Serratia plymuthica]|nr:hypothetical protein ALQ63_02046 [Serratia plymuthica]
MTDSFTGFSQQGLNFLQQVRLENDKDWFEANRNLYERELLTPFRTLVAELSPAMLAIDPQFETRPAIGKTLSRLHRDTRFSHDKSRYRSRMWLTFKRPSKDWKDAPVYFFELGPDMLRYGLGYYSANKPTMDLFRHTLLRRGGGLLSAAVRAGGGKLQTPAGERAGGGDRHLVQPQIFRGDGQRQPGRKAVQRRPGADADAGFPTVGAAVSLADAGGDDEANRSG